MNYDRTLDGPIDRCMRKVADFLFGLVFKWIYRRRHVLKGALVAALLWPLHAL